MSVDASMNAFMLYQSGVMTNAAGCGTDLDHAVVAVGYNTEGPVPYYIVRNSWGTDWGENGYINLEIIEGEGTCGVQIEPQYPNSLLVASYVEYWLILTAMALTLFVSVPFSYY